MTQRATVSVPGVVLRAVLVLAVATGCSRESQVGTQSDEIREHVFTTGRQAAAHMEREYAELGVSVVHFPEQDRWTDCGEDLAADTEVPDAIQWLTTWQFTFDTRRETASLIDEIGAVYVADGWEQGEDSGSGTGRLVTFRRDGYVMLWGGDRAVDPDRATLLGLTVAGPCAPAPQDIREWTPEPEPAP
ncbi:MULTISPECIES: hypothetical protein [unclassified Actinotalea]|uniref:hypothetical protein n=1 Tax=unclassified Actinotalea TaxID=2638618 RepID=UPI0015F38B8B|nr:MULTISPECIES: hypothetical protein [unclassified Actinotalea]